MWNPFNQRKVPYLRMIGHKEFSETDSDVGDEPSSSMLYHKEANDLFDAQARHRSQHFKFAPCCGNVLIPVISLLIGLFAGQFLRAQYSVDGYIAPYADSTRNIANIKWSQNTTFSLPPSRANEDAWSTLMPFGRGFVTHPSLTNNVPNAVSAFHQIHCLHGLRTAYYAQTNSLDKLQHRLNPNHKYKKNEYLDGMSEHELGLHHVKHCFEYLRQAIMCATDTNLEPVSITPDGGHVTEPWDATRVCRDWEGVRKWAAQWTAGDGEGIVGK